MRSRIATLKRRWERWMNGRPDRSKALSFLIPAFHFTVRRTLSSSKNPLTLSYKGRKFPVLQLVSG